MNGASVPASTSEVVPEIATAKSGEISSTTPLTFAELNRRLSAIPDHDRPSNSSRRWARIGNVGSLVAYASLLAFQHISMNEGLRLGLMLLCLFFVISGLVINVWATRGEFVSLVTPFQDFAKQLDHDFPYHFEIHAWLTAQTLPTLEKHAAMSKFRRERFTQKLPMVAGGVATLGIIPVLVAVYFQGRQLLEGHSISLIDGIFVFILALFYWQTWTSSLTKSRLEAMDMYLQNALTEVKGDEASAIEARNKTTGAVV